MWAHLQTELIGREGLFKAAPFQVAGCSFSKEPVVRPQAAFTPCGSRAWSPGCRQELWEGPVLGMLEPVFLGLPQPGSLCGGCERSVTLGAVQKHGVVQLSTPVPGRLFLSRPCFLRACPLLRLALLQNPRVGALGTRHGPGRTHGWTGPCTASPRLRHRGPSAMKGPMTIQSSGAEKGGPAFGGVSYAPASEPGALSLLSGCSDPCVH